MPTSLVVNAGSTSHKLALLELTGQGRLPYLWQAQVDWGSQAGLLRWRWGKIHGNRTPSAFTIIMAAAIGNPALRLVSLHLGGGCSASAVRGLRCQDTSMGFTPPPWKGWSWAPAVAAWIPPSCGASFARTVLTWACC